MKYEKLYKNDIYWLNFINMRQKHNIVLGEIQQFPMH